MRGGDRLDPSGTLTVAALLHISLFTLAPASTAHYPPAQLWWQQSTDISTVQDS